MIRVLDERNEQTDGGGDNAPVAIAFLSRLFKTEDEQGSYFGRRHIFRMFLPVCHAPDVRTIPTNKKRPQWIGCYIFGMTRGSAWPGRGTCSRISIYSGYELGR